MTPKQLTLKKCPNAELVRDGWHRKAGPSGCFDFAIFAGKKFIAEGPTPKTAWENARHVVERWK